MFFRQEAGCSESVRMTCTHKLVLANHRWSIGASLTCTCTSHLSSHHRHPTANTSLYPGRSVTMTLTMRPLLLRQALAAPARRTLSPSTSAVPALVASQLQRQPFQQTQRVGFRTTSPRGILPPLPQRIPGDVNEPAPVPGPDPAHGSYHWTAERYHIPSSHPPKNREKGAK